MEGRAGEARRRDAEAVSRPRGVSRPSRQAASDSQLRVLARSRNSSRAIETVRGRITPCGETPSSGGPRMAIDPEQVKALFQAAFERGDPASHSRSLTMRSATTTSCRHTRFAREVMISRGNKIPGGCSGCRGRRFWYWRRLSLPRASSSATATSLSKLWRARR